MTVSNHLIDDGRGSEISVNCALCSHYPVYCAEDSGAAVLVILSPTRSSSSQHLMIDIFYQIQSLPPNSSLNNEEEEFRIGFLNFGITTSKLTDSTEYNILI